MCVWLWFIAEIVDLLGFPDQIHLASIRGNEILAVECILNQFVGGSFPVSFQVSGFSDRGQRQEVEFVSLYVGTICTD